MALTLTIRPLIEETVSLTNQLEVLGNVEPNSIIKDELNSIVKILGAIKISLENINRFYAHQDIETYKEETIASVTEQIRKELANQEGLSEEDLAAIEQMALSHIKAEFAKH